ncbi:protein transport protein Sec61 subunit gamma isoform X1 [Narcine bancroftii]|uniref:protein transport protein Sec61 subunit gamma isoform X1 n=1 Tax=Narcine bancroftii TaxID=1343680 RepID=UPI003831B8E8
MRKQYTVLCNVSGRKAANFSEAPRETREDIMDQVMQFVEPSRQFVKDSIRLVKRCTKPDRKDRKNSMITVKSSSSSTDRDHGCLIEFQKIAMATAIGFAIMGFIGFFVKLIHIPINNIIVGG